MDEVNVWCEGLTVFGANFVCAAAAFVAGPDGAIGCGLGNFVGKSAALSAYCASEQLLELCNK